MKRFLALLCLCLALVQPARAGLQYSMAEGEAFFPEEEGWRYHYSYRYPLIEGDSFPAQAVNEYFELALREQTQLVLPMYANDPIMTMDGPQTVSDSYEVMLSDERLFSVDSATGRAWERKASCSASARHCGQRRLHGRQPPCGACAGWGRARADRGSGAGGCVAQDRWRIGGEKGWLPGLSLQRLEEGFTRRGLLGAWGSGVFFLQPGEFRRIRP